MPDYYVFATQPEANACISFINKAQWFPVAGKTGGVDRPDAQKTTRWVDFPDKMTTGEWAVLRIPEERLDYVGVPQEDRDAFLAVFGQDIRTLTDSDFVQG